MVKESPAAEFSLKEKADSLYCLFHQAAGFPYLLQGAAMALEVLRNSSPVFQAKIHFCQKGCLLQNETSSCLEENGVSQSLDVPAL